MVETIISYLNAKLEVTGYFHSLYCLVEKKKEPREEGDFVYPATYVGGGDLELVEFDSAGFAYFRKNGDFGQSVVANDLGQKQLYSIDLPFRLVAMVRRQDVVTDDAYSPDRLARELASILTFRNGDLRTFLQASRVTVTSGSWTTNPEQIWTDETEGTGRIEPDYSRAFIAMDVTVNVLADEGCIRSACTDEPDILRLFDFCDPSVVARLTPEQVTCLEAALCDPCEDATVTVNTSPFGTAPSGGGLNVPVKNTAGTLKGSKIGSDWVVPDATFQQNTIQRKLIPTGTSFNLVTKLDGVANNGVWDGVDTLDFTSAPCPPVANVSVALSTSTPAFDQVVTVTATATGITATSYTFYLPSYNGKMLPVTQASNVYLWTVKEVGSWTVRVTATDGSETGVGTIAGSTVGDVHASAFIARHNTVSGATMHATYQTYVLGWFLRAKGIYTTHAVDAFTPEIAAGSEVYLYIPVNATTFSIPAFFINAFNPSEVATPVGFVGADASVNGLTGGVGKHALFNRAPSHFGQNNIGIDVYARAFVTSTISMGSAVGADGFSSVASAIGHASSRIRHQGNDAANLVTAGTDVTGLISLNRNAASFRFGELDGEANMAYATDAVFGYNVTSAAPSTLPYMGHACNGSTGAHRHTTSSICFLAVRSVMDDARRHTWAEAAIWLQTQFGRNV